jgi:hypothetical protein
MKLKLQAYWLQRKLQAYMIIAYRSIAYKLLPIGFRFEKSWELDKTAMQWFGFFVKLLMIIFLAICFI